MSFERAKKIVSFFFGERSLPQPDLASDQVLAEKLASEERAEYAVRLQPYIGHLAVVTDFGRSNIKMHALRVTADLVRNDFGSDTPLGISNHIHVNRGVQGEFLQLEAAEELYASFVNRNEQFVRQVIVDRDETHFLLRKIVLATGETARHFSNVTPVISHIAMIAAIDSNILGIPYAFDPGTAFLLKDSNPDTGFTWQTISPNNTQHYTAH